MSDALAGQPPDRPVHVWPLTLAQRVASRAALDTKWYVYSAWPKPTMPNIITSSTESIRAVSTMVLPHCFLALWRDLYILRTRPCGFRKNLYVAARFLQIKGGFFFGTPTIFL